MVMILSFVLGGFILAIAMERWNLYESSVDNYYLIGASTSKILLGFMVATGFLYVCIETAAVMIMIPIGLAIIKEAHDLQEANTNQKVFKSLKKSLVLAIGYAGTIGGLGTLIGTLPLIILKGQYMQHFGHEISFAKWMIVGFQRSLFC